MNNIIIETTSSSSINFLHHHLWVSILCVLHFRFVFEYQFYAFILTQEQQHHLHRSFYHLPISQVSIFIHSTTYSVINNIITNIINSRDLRERKRERIFIGENKGIFILQDWIWKKRKVGRGKSKLAYFVRGKWLFTIYFICRYPLSYLPCTREWFYPWISAGTFFFLPTLRIIDMFAPYNANSIRMLRWERYFFQILHFYSTRYQGACEKDGGLEKKILFNVSCIKLDPVQQ
jgi:hypothetical protein